jgi:hypothetical protein
VTGSEKRDHFALLPNFTLIRLYLRNRSSYELETRHEYSSIILLHSLGIPSGLLRPWNGDSLKNDKKTRLEQSGPFSQILSQLSEQILVALFLIRNIET